MSTETVLSSASSAAAALIDGRIVPNTKKLYEQRLKTIKQFYTDQLQLEFGIPVTAQHIISFFGWLIDVKHKNKPVSISTVRQYKSALMWCYSQDSQIMLPELNQQLESVLKGYQRQIAEYKQQGRMAVFEGKYHLTFEGYRILAKLLFTSQPFNQMLFGWPFLVLQWNLIARSATVSSLMMEHISWEGDSLVITTPKHKGDQQGANCFPRHLYANPANPVICPVLSLAILTFVRGLRHDPVSRPSSSSSNAMESFRVFDGDNNGSRFSDILHRIIKTLPPSEVQVLGGIAKELGTHSVRKGAATYCAGMINGPTPVHVYLRAGWSLGVQDRYLFQCAGGDQLTGRALSGLPFTEYTFASLAPHFTEEGKDSIDWNSILPLWSKLPGTIKRALPYLLASICYHEEWLRSTLPANHPLFNTQLFASGAVAQLKPHVVTGCNRCPVTGMVATGIPPHLVMSNNLTAVVEKTESLKATLLSRCDELPTQLVDLMLSKVNVTGAIPVTLDTMKTLLNQQFVQMRTELLAACAVEKPAAVIDPNRDPRFQVWSWGGKMHMVPEKWKFPSTNVKDIWYQWHFGHVAEKIQPLRLLHSYDLETDAQVTMWSKARGVIDAISQTMVDMQLVPTVRDVQTLTADVSMNLFDQAIVALMEKVKEGSTQQRTRWIESSIPTLYEKLRKKELLSRKRKRQEQESAAGREQGDS